MIVSEVVCKGAQFEWYREPTWPVSKNETGHLFIPGHLIQAFCCMKDPDLHFMDCKERSVSR